MHHVTRSIRICLLDCLAVARYGGAMRLAQEPDFEFVHGLSSTADLLRVLPESLCDVLVLDYSLSRGEADGITLLRNLARRFPAVRTLVWSSQPSSAQAVLAHRAGAWGFIGKTHDDLQELVDAVRAVASGRMYFSRDYAGSLCMARNARSPVHVECGEEEVDSAQGATDLVSLTTSLLSPKEREVLRCCLDALSIGEVARKFNRSVKTVSTQKNSAYRKLGIRNDGELFKLSHELAGQSAW